MNSTQTTTPTRYTPADHAASSSPLKAARVISTSATGERGPCALIEFEGGFSRTVDLPTHMDANHAMFDVLESADKWKLRNAAALVVPVGDGTVKVYNSGFSFASKLRTQRGAWIADNDFDVPLEGHRDGYLTGYRCARELLEAMKSGRDDSAAKAIICAAAVAAGEQSKGNAPSRQWAAHGFMTAIEGALRGAARHTNISAYIDMLESNQLESAAHLDAHYAEHTKQRIAKSVATRKARAVQRKVAAAIESGAAT